MKHTLTLYYQVQYDDDPRGCLIDQKEVLEFSTAAAARKHFDELRLYRHDGNRITLYRDDVLVEECYLR